MTRYVYNETDGWGLEHNNQVTYTLPEMVKSLLASKWDKTESWAKGKAEGCVPFGVWYDIDCIVVHATIDNEEITLNMYRLSNDFDLYNQVALFKSV